MQKIHNEQNIKEERQVVVVVCFITLHHCAIKIVVFNQCSVPGPLGHHVCPMGRFMRDDSGEETDWATWGFIYSRLFHCRVFIIFSCLVKKNI